MREGRKDTMWMHGRKACQATRTTNAKAQGLHCANLWVIQAGSGRGRAVREGGRLRKKDNEVGFAGHSKVVIFC